ncbi:hypothetical protein P4S54_20135 [Shewanella sp. PP-He15 brown]
MLSPLGFDLYDFGLCFNTFSIALNSMLWRALSSAEIYVIYAFHLETLAKLRICVAYLEQVFPA